MTTPPENHPPAPYLSDLPDLPDPRPLHEATDRLNKVLVDAEKALAALNLGVSAWAVLEEDGRGWFKTLEFIKIGSDFKLMIVTGLEGDETTTTKTPLISASRETRLDAVAALPKLYKQLVKAVGDETERVNKSIIEVERLTSVIRAKKAAK
jgi:hypothetical protein